MSADADQAKAMTDGKAGPAGQGILASTISQLLTEQIVHSGWEGSVGGLKSFYVRGVTWLHQHVLPSVSELQLRSKEDFGPIFAAHPGFEAPGFNWREVYSPRQGMAALSVRSRAPVKFNKAVQTILLCHKLAQEKVASGDLAIDPDDVLRRLRIEPAIFYIRDFEKNQLERLTKDEPRILEKLRERTGQRTRVVFNDMAYGQTVTKKLVDATRAALVEMFPNEDFGSVDYRFQPGFTKAASASEALSD